MVTVGSQMALDLTTRILVDPGDVILAEAPS
jgi:DNA-binding transcriptional MocR family regulator